MLCSTKQRAAMILVFLFDASAIFHIVSNCVYCLSLLLNSVFVYRYVDSVVFHFFGGRVRRPQLEARIGKCYNLSANDDDDCFLIGKTSTVEFFMLFTCRLAIGRLNGKSM